ncbi:MAG: hypothetical protein RLZZ24_1294 [Pseudomonadota bacterium]|jgi:hypothetical protein
MSELLSSRRRFSTRLMIAAMGGLAACSTSAPPKRTAKPKPAPDYPLSSAQTERQYRADVAKHLYAHNHARIYQGKLPPMLYAIGVTRLSISSQGEVLDIDWMRRPKHAPEVIEEIERTIRAAAPLPVAPALAHLSYTETWLWHRSGRFQLDTLTEGQS